MADDKPSVSLVTSTYVTLGVTQVLPLITWIEQGCPLPAPDAVNGLFAMIIVGAVHLGQKAVARWMGDKDGDGLPDPVVPVVAAPHPNGTPA